MTSEIGFHEDLSREEKIEGSTDKGFGQVFAAFFGLLGGLAWWHNNPRWYWWIALSAATLIIALTVPRVLAPFNWLWTRLGLILFKVISPIALAVIYYGTLTPIAVYMRLRKKDVLHLKYDPQAASYWVLRQPPGPPPETMKNQF